MKVISDVKKVRKGIDFAVDILEKTLGPGGYNTIIGQNYIYPVITNDGISILKAIELEDELEQLGVDYVKQICERTSKEVEDATTTTATLFRSILNRGFELLGDEKSLTKDFTPLQIKDKLNTACDEVIKELKKSSSKVKNIEDVAFVSTESKELAKMIKKAFDSVGKDGIVLVEESSGYSVELNTVKGINVKDGLASRYLANKKGKFIANDIFCMVRKELDRKDIENKAKELRSANVNQMLLFVKNISDTDLDTFVGWKLSDDSFTVAVVKVWDDEIRMDLEKATNDDKIDQVIITEKGSTLIGTRGDLKERIKYIKAQSADTEFDKEQQKKRIASLGGGIALINVGARSDSEKEYLNLKIKNGVGAVKAAQKEGVLKGGGIALNEIENETFGKALTRPYDCIQENSDNIEVGEDIVDATKAIRVALLNACNGATTLLTTNYAIAIKKEKDKE